VIAFVEERRTIVETGKHRERGEAWKRGEDWARVERLLELARSAHREELSPERRARIREGLLERLERDQIRRRRARAFVIGASTVVLAGLLLMLAQSKISIR
jgi:hypothetical protein